MNKIVLLIAMLLFAAFIMADAMPDFRLPDLNGKNVSLEDLLGKGPVMMDFWADYCKPCKDAMPVLNGLAEKYDSLTIVMVSIDAPKNQSKAKTYLKSKNYKFVNLFDCEKALAKKLGVGTPPHTFIMDKNGEIVYSHLGYTPGVEAEYEHHIRSLLGLETEAE
ncbi:MAG TPA: TlpA disulfide reductase family protein [Candidatus Cloacimonas sp.]|jgi:peroxiredoxin|nr:TlpA disulfide reductase family protein [Candidatus Cloacimonas sp.]